MQFLHPYWLLGLLAIAIPIVIHLFNFRRYKKVYFTNLKFLKSIKNETKKKQKLRHLLILISRILAIIFLVMAFARPYIPGPAGKQKSATTYVSVYVDNSMSMQAAMNGNSVLDLAKARASTVVESYNPSDRFQLITNDFEGRHQRYHNRDEFNTLLAEVKISPAFRTFDEISVRMNETELADNEADIHQYYISDFQLSAYASGFTENDTARMVFLLPLVDEAFGNIYIDSCWFETPYNHVHFPQEINVRINNASANTLEKIPVKLMVNNRQHALGSVDLPGWGGALLSLPVDNMNAGLQWAYLQIEDYPIAWDDKLYLNWSVKQRIPVMVISESAPGYYLEKVFGNDSVFVYQKELINKLDYSVFKSFDLIVLDNIRTISSGLAGELESFVSSGGSLLIIPSDEADIQAVSFLTQTLGIGSMLEYDTSALSVTGLNAEHSLFEGVFEDLPENLDLPAVAGHFPLSKQVGTYHEVIMDLQNGDPYLVYADHGKGKAYLLTTPLGDGYGNLSRHALWVPVAYRISMMSRPQDLLYYTLGNDVVVNADLAIPQDDEQLMIRKIDSEYEFIPAITGTVDQQKLMFFDRISIAGHYGVFLAEDLLQGFSFNYDRHESNPAILSKDDLRKNLESQGNANVFILDSVDGQSEHELSSISQGRELWKYFIWLALFFILLEILLLRLFRK